MDTINSSTIACPECGYEKTEEMSPDTCVLSWECERCKAMLKPLAGDCCVYCSYGSAECRSARDRREMGYSLTFENRPQFLFAKVQADSIDNKVVIAYLTEVANRCIETDNNKVLVVRDISTMLGITDQFHTTTGFIEQMSNRKAAFVNPYPFVEDELGFAMTVAKNRGGNFEVFRDVEAAEKWLLS